MRLSVVGVAIAALAATSAAVAQTPRLAIDLPAPSDPPPGGPTSGVGPSIRALDILADGQTRDLLRSGFPARLHFRVELWHTGGILNSLDGTREWDVIARYDPLGKRFRAARLIEIVQVFDKFLEALGFALRLPLAHELREAVEIFAVFGSHGRADFQGPGELVE